DELRRSGLERQISQTTGLIIDPYFSATKIRWILENVDGARSLANSGHLAFGTVDTWLLWNLTGGRMHATDATNASRTMLLDLESLEWDAQLLSLFDIPESMLPEVQSSSHVFASSDKSLLGRSIPISGIAGDQQSALFGQLCTTPGMAKNTYGTGCFLLRNTGKDIVRSSNRLLSTVGIAIGSNVQYALEGSVFVGGAVVQWLRDGLQIIDDSSEIEALARTVPDSGGVVFVPAFTGLGAPHWDPFARGSINGITRGTTRAHLARAALESIALQTMDVLEAMNADAADPLGEIRVDGGASRNDLLMQIQADVTQVPVVRTATPEATALGAAFLAGLAVGLWNDTSDLQSLWRADRTFLPTRDHGELNKAWQKGVSRTKDWARD
ncbi:MAG: glycerol kinase GlpK, partial [Rhodothermales bacterium]|nr:glycerol kinase GlpK [Rhodothermales bacterium]